MRVFLLSVLLFIGCVSPLFAHELLPKEIVQYIKENPNATPDELRRFTSTQDPAVAAQFKDSSGEELLAILQNPDSDFTHNFLDFIEIGVRHILGGLDHILFVGTLLFAFASLREVVKLVTSFTLAHSITIVLAGTGTLLLSTAVVEPLIALSIAIMAIMTAFFSEHPLVKNQWAKVAVVFFFGLFHGLGFAGLLTEIAIPANKFLSSLFAFNIGIEIGQLIVILLALPAILYFKDRAWYARAKQVAAVLVTLIALVWFVQRIS